MKETEINDCIAEAIRAKGIIDLNADDFKLVMDNGANVHSFLKIGKGDSPLSQALQMIEEDADRQSVELFQCKKVVIGIFVCSKSNSPQHLTPSDFDAFTNFLSRFGDDFETKWGLYASSNLKDDEAKVLLIAC